MPRKVLNLRICSGEDGKMTRDDLGQLKALKTEIKLLQEDIRRTNRIQVKDSVKGSSPGHPWGLHNIVIEGADTVKQDRVYKKMGRKLNELQDRICEMENWMDGVEDSEMRSILRLRYRNGLSWQQVAFGIGKFDESYPRKKHNEFFNQSEKSENNDVL